MTPRVCLIEPGDTPEHAREIIVNQPEFLIGRGTDCDLRLPVAAISRHHCIIRVSAGEVTVIDLGSSNGTYLNGQRVRSQAVLHGGDRLQVGTCNFLVSLSDGSEAEQKLIRGADPLAVTHHVRDIVAKREKGGHPPGEAGGLGGSAG